MTVRDWLLMCDGVVGGFCRKRARKKIQEYCMVEQNQPSFSRDFSLAIAMSS